MSCTGTTGDSEHELLPSGSVLLFFWTLFCLFAFLVAVTQSAAWAAGDILSTVSLKVVRVVDGDTIICETPDGAGEDEVSIRLYGIDAPEKKQEHGERATKALRSLCGMGDFVTVRVSGIDHYGRVIGECFIHGTSLNRWMVKNGHAWWYEAYAGKDRDLAACQDLAAKGKVGLWAQKMPVAPWTYRQKIRGK